jgi:hypothetical protein
MIVPPATSPFLLELFSPVIIRVRPESRHSGACGVPARELTGLSYNQPLFNADRGNNSGSDTLWSHCD